MEGCRGEAVGISPAEKLYLGRACELAARGIGSTSPNPPVGAVIVREGTILGEGFHRVRGAPHAEVEALDDARARGHDTAGATMFVSLEPCDHHGLTPPCAQAVVAAGIARVVVGVADPNPKTDGAGLARLREAGIAVQVVDDPKARKLVEPFAVAIRSARPFVTLKMAASLDGYVAPRPGSYWLTSAPSRERVRELRYAHDAVFVGAGTVRTDDPQLTVRPHHARHRPYARVIACQGSAVPPEARVFAPGSPAHAYRKTIVLAPAGKREEFTALEAVADCVYVGNPDSQQLDLAAALCALKDAGIASVLCEGGPALASALLVADLVDSLVWFIAPLRFASEEAVPALAPYATLEGWSFETIERSGDDVVLTANLRDDV